MAAQESEATVQLARNVVLLCFKVKLKVNYDSYRIQNGQNANKGYELQHTLFVQNLKFDLFKQKLKSNLIDIVIISGTGNSS